MNQKLEHWSIIIYIKHLFLQAPNLHMWGPFERGFPQTSHGRGTIRRHEQQEQANQRTPGSLSSPDIGPNYAAFDRIVFGHIFCNSHLTVTYIPCDCWRHRPKDHHQTWLYNYTILLYLYKFVGLSNRESNETKILRIRNWLSYTSNYLIFIWEELKLVSYAYLHVAV